MWSSQWSCSLSAFRAGLQRKSWKARIFSSGDWSHGDNARAKFSAGTARHSLLPAIRLSIVGRIKWGSFWRPFRCTPCSPLPLQRVSEQIGKTLYRIFTALRCSLRYMLIALLPGQEGGTISLRGDGQINIKYPFDAPIPEAFRASHKVLGRLHLRQVLRRCNPPRPQQFAKAAASCLGWTPCRFGALEHGIFSAHQMGGLAMGNDTRS